MLGEVKRLEVTLGILAAVGRYFVIVNDEHTANKRGPKRSRKRADWREIIFELWVTTRRRLSYCLVSRVEKYFNVQAERKWRRGEA